MQLNELTMTQAGKGLEEKEFSSFELTQACLQEIEKRNPSLNAFITVCADEALAQAKEADTNIAAGKQTSLTGIPYSVKDAICTKGIRSTGGAKILDNYVPPFDATVIAKIRAQGAVCIGKTNCDAFGHGASNEHSMYGPVRNPFDETKVAGGSSGGSAASVAAGMCLFSIGEDTGGSIRQPASFCGIVGLRPTYGRNSRYGVMPMASSLDTVGPMAKTVEDVALLMEIMAGHDPYDATTVSDPVPTYTEQMREMQHNQDIRIGIPKEYVELEGMDAETKEIVESSLKRLEAKGYHLMEVSLPHTTYAIPAYYIIVPSEDSSNLARLEGIRYGIRGKGETLEDVYALSRQKGFPDEVKRRIMMGTYTLSAGYYDAYYRKAQQMRTLIIQDFQNVFALVDVLLTPTSPFPAFGIGEKSDDVLAMYVADMFVSPASVAGLPAVSVPVGRTQTGLPVGLQVIGKRLEEGAILGMAALCEIM